LTEQDDVITLLLRGAPRLGLALGPAPARAGPGGNTLLNTSTSNLNTPSTLSYIEAILSESLGWKLPLPIPNKSWWWWTPLFWKAVVLNQEARRPGGVNKFPG